MYNPLPMVAAIVTLFEKVGKSSHKLILLKDWSQPINKVLCGSI